jgi:hypothetical protein
MEKFLLTTEPSKLSISGTIYWQMIKVDWTGERDIEVKKFIIAYYDILNNITLKKLKNNEKRIDRLKSFGANEDLLKKRVSLIL